MNHITPQSGIPSNLKRLPWVVTGIPLQPVVASFTEKHVIAQIAKKTIITAATAQVIIPQITICPICKGSSGPEISPCRTTPTRHFGSS
jgi:hypothetical protein